MITRRFDRDSMTWSYEMYLQPMLDSETVHGLPFGSVFGSVPAHTVSKRHAHQDDEIFLVLQGGAIVCLDGEERLTRAGDVVHLEPFGFHEIRNESDESYDIVSIFWENASSVAKALETNKVRAKLPERALVCCPPVTPNGGLHLGHLSGPYVRADMYARALRSMERHARYLTGTDDHQSHVARNAEKERIEPADLAAAWRTRIIKTLSGAEISPDRFTAPVADAVRTERVRKLFHRVLESPSVTWCERESAYCPACEVSLHQAFISGECPTCRAPGSGEICEACGRPNEARELVEAHCESCGGAASVRQERAAWLDPSCHTDALRAYLEEAGVPPDTRALLDDLLDGPEGLAPYRLTRDGDWGTDVGENQRMDAWVDLSLTYLDAVREERDEHGPAEVTLFLGYDNSYYYAVLLPALALALGEAELLPSDLVTNQFLHLDGEKFSTSREHAVWGTMPSPPPAATPSAWGSCAAPLKPGSRTSPPRMPASWERIPSSGRRAPGCAASESWSTNSAARCRAPVRGRTHTASSTGIWTP
ncbi:class I tRNA ligase family protein [Nocardiopsis xinjiangensis]|uniref:class I tRNA ligase family protein n=1 Tax=Nocardiopsis xinjiangensis TaxID=124285 RepID=UPI000349199B|nr:class I tRNA ligase family protein [Nocardiopsis xinjiangensis]